MAVGSGLGSQFMFAAESTWGTAVTVTKTIEHLQESLKWTPTWLEGAGLKAGQTFRRVGRTSVSKFTVSGDFSVEAVDKGLGVLLKHALGSSAGPTQIGSTTAYKTIFTPGDKTALGLTIQVGRPQTDGTVRAHTYFGCKITEWEFTCKDGAMAMWKFSIDGQNETVATALATASYATGVTPFTFADSSVFKFGGTATTTSGLMSVASGVTAATVFKGITISGKTPLETDRHGLGAAGAKRNQIQNNFSELSVKLDGEYTSRAEIYDVFKANTTTALQASFTHGDASGDASAPYTLDFILSGCKFKTAQPNVKGPDIVDQSVELEAYDDESGTNAPVQIVQISTDVAL